MENVVEDKEYQGNRIITSTVPDFRDPHVFWNE